MQFVDEETCAPNVRFDFRELLLGDIAQIKSKDALIVQFFDGTERYFIISRAFFLRSFPTAFCNICGSTCCCTAHLIDEAIHFDFWKRFCYFINPATELMSFLPRDQLLIWS